MADRAALRLRLRIAAAERQREHIETERAELGLTDGEAAEAQAAVTARLGSLWARVRAPKVPKPTE